MWLNSGDGGCAVEEREMKIEAKVGGQHLARHEREWIINNQTKRHRTGLAGFMFCDYTI